MWIIGVDYHPSDQYIAFVDTETGESGERRLNHGDGEAERFYRELRQRVVSVRVGMEAIGYSRRFERLRAELGVEVRIGDAAKVCISLTPVIAHGLFSQNPRRVSPSGLSRKWTTRA
jgi:transposase